VTQDPLRQPPLLQHPRPPRRANYLVRVAVAASILLAYTPAAAQEPDSAGWRIASLAGVTGLYAGVGTWAYFAWYDQPPEHGFRFNEDGWFGADTYAGGSDKLGHLWSNLALTRLNAHVLEAGGWSPRTAHWLSAGLSTAFFTLVEVKDAYYYAFSWGDMAANIGGVGLALLAHEFPGADELLDFRVSYWPSAAYRTQGGVNFAEDYSGQTYLLAFHLEPVLPSSKWYLPARYLDVVGGYRTVNYKPDREPRDAYPRRREPFLGLTLNLGQALDDLTLDANPRAQRLTHHITEHVNIPFTALPLVPPGALR
jgi:hypothetical protein